MRGRCAIKTCSIPKETRKIHEDFEALIYNVCWECGTLIKETQGYVDMSGFSNIIRAIELQVK